MTDITISDTESGCESCGFDKSQVLILTNEGHSRKELHLCPVCSRTLQWQLQDTLQKYHSQKVDG